MKKIFYILLSAVVLVASLGVTGAFAADGDILITDYPDFGVTFTQVNPIRSFFKLNVSDLTTDSFTDLFNGISAKRLSSSSNELVFSYNGEQYIPSEHGFTASGPYYYFSTANNGLNLSFASTTSGSVAFNSNVYPTGSIAYNGMLISITTLNIASSGNSNGQVYIAPASVIGEVIDFAIPAGYAFVIEGPCEILERSYYINNSWDFTSNGNYRVNGSFEKILGSSYIVDGFSPDTALSASQLIQWEALNPNIFGTASYYEFYDNTLVQLNYEGENYVIGYPTLYGFGNSNSRLLFTNSVDMVCHLYLNYTTRPTFRWIALESLSEFTNIGNFHTYSVFRPEEVDSEGSSSEGSGGTVVTPSDSLPSGGGNAGQPPVDEDSSLLGTISRLVNNIKQLLSSAVNAINDLVAEGSQFMRSVAQMFTWLPEQLTSLLIAAFTILVVVGVLKVLWR